MIISLPKHHLISILYYVFPSNAVHLHKEENRGVHKNSHKQ